jgi:hypothetical protein
VDAERCACGRPLHYQDPETEARVRFLIGLLGTDIRVNTPYGSWLVPRHYIALHGIVAAQLADVARAYGFPRVDGARA